MEIIPYRLNVPIHHGTDFESKTYSDPVGTSKGNSYGVEMCARGPVSVGVVLG